MGKTGDLNVMVTTFLFEPPGSADSTHSVRLITRYTADRLKVFGHR
jgi:hypothetical protein